jgi:mannose-6-phosphate isomerase-like protein (cupin superfamily)
MKLSTLLAASALLATPAFAQDAVSRSQNLHPETPPITYVSHDKVQAALDGKAGLHLVDAKDLAVEGCFRNKPGEPEVHQTLTNTFFITDGEATLMVGGTVTGQHEIAPGQLRGGVLTGATAYHVVKGDVFVIRPGIPTWFSEVPNKVSYYVVKEFNK